MTKEQLCDILGTLDEKVLTETNRHRSRRPGSWKKAGLIAACLAILLVGGYSAHPLLRSPGNMDPGTESEQSAPVVEADMVGYFLHNGRTYVQHNFFLPEGNPIEKRVGTIAPSIHELTGETEYADGTGSVGGSIYSLKGYDPAEVLCMVNADGTLASYLSTDIWDSGLHLLESAKALSYAPAYAETEAFLLSVGQDEVQDFLNALTDGEITSLDNPSASRLFHASVLLDGGLRLNLSFHTGGYVGISCLHEKYLKLPDGILDPLLSLMYAKLGEPTSLAIPSPSLADCLEDPVFGAYVPDYTPYGYTLTAVERYYHIDPESGSFTETRQIVLAYDSDDGYYSLEMVRSSDYGETGWSGPVISPEELSPNVLAEYYKGEDGFTSLGISQGEVLVILSCRGLPQDDILRIFTDSLE